jgi:integrase
MAESLRGKPDALIVSSARIRGLTPVDYRKSRTKLSHEIKRPDLRLHDLRHHVARDLLRRGHSVAQVAAVLGHRDRTITTRRYPLLASLRGGLSIQFRNTSARCRAIEVKLPKNFQ